MKRLIVLVAALATSLSVWGMMPCEAYAEFLRTSLGVYQHTDQRSKVVISNDPENAGIFIVQVENPIDLQRFHPATIAKKNANHVFISYSYSTNRFDQVMVGNQTYRVKGSFTLLLNDLRITVDNVDKAYLSIVYNDLPGVRAEPDVLGILALEPVVNNSGEVAVALLEAHQFEFKDIIKPYVVTRKGLLLRGSPVNSPVIGLGLEQPKNPCLEKDTVLLSRRELIEKVYTLRDRQSRLNMLTEMLERAESQHLYKDLLSLRSDENRFIGYLDGKIYLVKPFKRTSEWQTCLVEEVSLDE